MMRVGFVGTGKMGKLMAQRILAAGFPLAAFDLDERPLRDLARLGAAVANSPAAVAERSDIVMLMLPPDTATVEGAMMGPQGVLAGLNEGGIVMDGGNTDPRVARRLGKVVQEKGCFLLDVGVSGGTVGAAAGTLTVMVGGDEESYRRALPVLEPIGKKIVYCGRSGSGHLMKLFNNVLFHVSVAAVAEALSLGTALGVDPVALMEIVTVSTGRSYAADLALKMCGTQEKPGLEEFWNARGLGPRQVQACLEMSDEIGLPMPVTAAVQQVDKMSSVGQTFQALDIIKRLYWEASAPQG